MELSKDQIRADLPENPEKVSGIPEKIAEEPKDSHHLPKSWHCDIYCRKVRHVSCEGRKHADSSAPELCPYYDEMLY